MAKAKKTTGSPVRQQAPPPDPDLISHDKAVLGLILNIVVLPGVGTLVGGRTTEGVLQLVLFLLGIPLIFVFIGIPLMIGMWVWALITGIDMINKSKPTAGL